MSAGRGSREENGVRLALGLNRRRCLSVRRREVCTASNGLQIRPQNKSNLAK